MNGFQTTAAMTVGLPQVGTGGERRPAFQRFSGLLSRIGVLSATLLLALASSLGSMGLTWIGLLARCGSEEFIMLLPNTPLAQAHQLAE